MVSVLMSTFNESENDLKESIESVLGQTYSDFEFIIVNDNPSNALLREVVLEYQHSDCRIKYLQNEKNMGLAMSLNRAASEAGGEYLLRMDADDISYQERFELQLSVLTKGDYDLVCSAYDVIDESSSVIRRNCGVYSDKTLRSVLPYEIAIHHPTVLMKRDKFERIGGYRNFKCAQDYDLWLRMWNAGYSMFLIDQPLLKYRVRSTSTTSQKKYLQKCTIDYITMLFHERLETGKDDYSYKRYLEYVDSLGANDQKVVAAFLKQHKMLSDANKKKSEGKSLVGNLQRGLVFLTSKSYRSSYLTKSKTSRLIRGINNGNQ